MSALVMSQRLAHSLAQLAQTVRALVPEALKGKGTSALAPGERALTRALTSASALRARPFPQD